MPSRYSELMRSRIAEDVVHTNMVLGGRLLRLGMNLNNQVLTMQRPNPGHTIAPLLASIQHLEPSHSGSDPRGCNVPWRRYSSLHSELCESSCLPRRTPTSGSLCSAHGTQRGCSASRRKPDLEVSQCEPLVCPPSLNKTLYVQDVCKVDMTSKKLLLPCVLTQIMSFFSGFRMFLS